MCRSIFPGARTGLHFQGESVYIACHTPMGKGESGTVVPLLTSAAFFPVRGGGGGCKHHQLSYISDNT